jgi:hypothetical protein
MTKVVNMEHVEQRGQEMLRRIIDFSRTHGAPRCYQNWAPEALQDYFCFHARQGTLAWIKAESGKRKAETIVGTAIAWQVDERVLRHGDLSGGYRFAWEPQDGKGECVFFGDVVATSPEAVICLLADFGRRFPHWRQLKWFTYRRGKLVQLRRRHLNLFLRKTKNYVQR